MDDLNNKFDEIFDYFDVPEFQREEMKSDILELFLRYREVMT